MAETATAGVENTTAQATTAATQATPETTATESQKADNSQLTREELEKLIQSSVDRGKAELGKKIAELQKENEKLKKANMSAEEVKQFELGEREKTIAAKERDLLDRENRLFAIKAIKEIGLDDGSDKSLELVDFVMGEDETAITSKVKAFNDLVNRFVSAKVDEKFKSIGRTPNGASTASTESKKENSIAAELGKIRADKAQASNNVLKHYIGG